MNQTLITFLIPTRELNIRHAMERKTKEKSVESVKSNKQACYQDQKSNMILCLNVVNYQWFDNNSFLAK